MPDVVPAGPPEVVGVIPCAGVSARMGESKALLDADGRSFLERVVVSLRDGGCGSVLVVVQDISGPVGVLADRLGAMPVYNPDPRDGPISSVRAAIARLREDGRDAGAVAICPVDHPSIRPDTVSKLIDVFRAARAPIVVPTYEYRGGHPIIFDSSLFDELLEPVLPDGARTVTRRHPDSLMRVSVTDPGVLLDLDTPEDYRRHFGHAPSKAMGSS